MPSRPDSGCKSDISRFFYSVAVTLLERAGLSPSEKGFRHAYALVSSRAFMVDAYHGLAMVPIADAFNHAQDNSVHLQSDHDVCTSCGSLSECPHDVDVETREDASTSAPGADTVESENTCEMVVNAAVAPGEEVFNTYGANLTNAELLVLYGFMLDANDKDILTWTTDEIWDTAGAALADLRPRRWDDDPSYGDFMEILRDWQYDAGWADSELVIDTEPDENKNPLYMTADGVLSHKLWLAIALATLRWQGTTMDVARTRQFLVRMARAQVRMEQGQTRARNDGSDEDDDAYKALDRLIRTIGELCARRLDRISRLNAQQQGDRGLGVHSAVVGKYIDDLDTAQQKTHLAVTLALEEISIVESCVSGWEELIGNWTRQAE
ncbi:SET domain-containing protein [Russula earlei]|uniref:SET domain-containing protein n=1 Tax=Russula earlei TaxID=71964 RepID=A0ACC0UJ01_9AGAM|nr:SET domain-containing protein [Russula earlei]